MSLPVLISPIVEHLREQGISEDIEAAVILGSGLSAFKNYIGDPIFLPYSQIPAMPSTSVAGHDGMLISGLIDNHKIIAFSGRNHYYEGFSFQETAIPVYIAKALNANKLIISNAAGAVNTGFSIGDLMIIESIIRNNLGIAPRGYHRYRYNHHQWVDKVQSLADEAGIETQKGAYFFSTGPNYETKAEIRAIRKMGGDAVGMSTAPELFEAARLNLKSTAISMISNMAAGISGKKLSHDEVKEAADSRKEDFATLVKMLVAEF